MKYPCDDCVFHRSWADDEIRVTRGCTHPLVYKAMAMCPSVMNYQIREDLRRQRND